MYIPLLLQNAIFGLLLFAIGGSKKVHNRAGYSSLFWNLQSQKSSRPKPSILKKQGYRIKQYFILFTVLLSIQAYASPFKDRDYSKCQDFYIVHHAKILEVLPTGDGVNNLYIVDMKESYFTWKNLVLRVRSDDPQWANLTTGDLAPVKMMRTTSDVVVSNPYIEETPVMGFI